MMSVWYRLYVLVVLMLVYLLNVVDRSIVTVLAPYIKADLNLTDAQIALLYGTAFALFYGLFGIPLARLADGWSRRNTLAIGLAFWSVMTCLSGCAKSLTQLGLVRAGVGVGEASASPAAVSLLSDYFSAERRGTVLAVYLTAIFLGGGVALMLGGGVVAWWSERYSLSSSAPLGLTGWRAAFFLAGLPGLLLALLVGLTIREPTRAFADQARTRPVQSVLEEAATIFPPWSYIRLRRCAVPGLARSNLIILAWIIVIATGAMLLSDQMLAQGHQGRIGQFMGLTITSNTVQWTSLGIAIYGSLSWAQALRSRQPDVFVTIVGSRSYMALVAGGGAIAVAMYSVNSFNFLYAVRYLGASADFAIRLGGVFAVGGILGTMGGGFVGDWLMRRHPAGRIWLLVGCYLMFGVACLIQYSTVDPWIFVAAFGVGTAFLSAWTPLINATAQDLLPENMRGRGYAVLQLGTNVLGLGLGPYCVGLISDSSGSLRLGLIAVISATVPAVLIAFAILLRTPQFRRMSRPGLPEAADTAAP